MIKTLYRMELVGTVSDRGRDRQQSDKHIMLGTDICSEGEKKA